MFSNTILILLAFGSFSCKNRDTSNLRDNASNKAPMVEAGFFYKSSGNLACFQSCSYSSELKDLHPLKIEERCDSTPKSIKFSAFSSLKGSQINQGMLNILLEEIDDVATTTLKINTKTEASLKAIIANFSDTPGDCDLKKSLYAGQPSVVQEFVKETPPNPAGFYRVSESEMGFSSAHLNDDRRWIRREYRSNSEENALKVCEAYHDKGNCEIKGTTTVKMTEFKPAARNLATDSSEAENLEMLEAHTRTLTPPSSGIALINPFSRFFKWLFGGDKSKSKSKPREYHVVACFTGETLVRTPQGLKPIAELKNGDDVLTLNDKDQLVTTKVIGKYRFANKQVGKLTFSDSNDSFTVTPEHPFLQFGTREFSRVSSFTNQKFSQLAADNSLSGTSAQYVISEQQKEVFNLILQGHKNYIAVTKNGTQIVSGVYDDGLLTAFNWRGYRLR